MRCETSFFSLTLYRKHLQRYWPMWAVWLVAWLLMLPVRMWSQSRWDDAQAVVRDAAQLATGWLPLASTLIAIAAPVVAVAVFFHLFRSPAANFVGALPLRREGTFATAFAAGYTILALPLAVVALLVLVVEASLNAVDAAALGTWLGGCLLMCFFWLCFAALCCVISGSGVAAVCFYGIFNAVIAGMTFLVQTVLAAFLYGFDQLEEGVWDTVWWCTPIYRMQLNDRALSRLPDPVGRMEMLWMYAAVGFLMLLAAVWLHHIRRAERAGDLIAFTPIRWVFRVSVTLCGGLSLGLLLMVILLDGHDPVQQGGGALAGCCALAAVISRFVAEMLLAKSFKVFQAHWKGAALGAVCFVLAICAIDMDWVGFTTRVPQPQQVRSAQAIFYGSVSEPLAREGLTYDGETVGELIALHEALVENRDSTGPDYNRLEVVYDLGLASLRRVYSYQTRNGDRLATLRDAAVEKGRTTFPVDGGIPVSGCYSKGDSQADLTPSQLEEVWAAVVDDVSAGRYRATGGSGGQSWDVYLEFQWLERGGMYTCRQFYPRSGTTSVNAVLQRLELAGQEAPQPESVELPRLANTVAKAVAPSEANGN